MNHILQGPENALTKVSYKIEKECGIKNGVYFVLLALMLIDSKTWTFDKAFLNRIYSALNIIEHNEELKKYFQEEEDGIYSVGGEQSSSSQA